MIMLLKFRSEKGLTCQFVGIFIAKYYALRPYFLFVAQAIILLQQTELTLFLYISNVLITNSLTHQIPTGHKCQAHESPKFNHA